MAHNLEFNELKGTVSFATARESAWHQLGTVVDSAMTTAEAIELANLDFEVKKTETLAQIGDEIIEIPKSFVTYRDDTKDILGVVGDKYHILQNTEAFQFFDPILDEGEAFIETAGVLNGGKQIFITAKLPEHIKVLGDHDPIDQYILITTSHDSKSGTTVMFTPIRVVCQNTLNVALGRKTLNKVSIKHTENQLSRLRQASQLMGLQNQYKLELEEIFYKMSDTKASDEIYEKIIVNGLADEPGMVKKYFDKTAKQSTRFRNNVETCLNYAFTNDTQLMPSCNGTVFGAYNAISGYFQNEVDWKDNSEAKMTSIVDGRAQKKNQQAFQTALQYI